jgi:hypothetical protein
MHGEASARARIPHPRYRRDDAGDPSDFRGPRSEVGGRAVLIIEPGEDVHEGAAIANLLGRIVTFYAFQRQVGDEDD